MDNCDTNYMYRNYGVMVHNKLGIKTFTVREGSIPFSSTRSYQLCYNLGKVRRCRIDGCSNTIRHHSRLNVCNSNIAIFINQQLTFTTMKTSSKSFDDNEMRTHPNGEFCLSFKIAKQMNIIDEWSTWQLTSQIEEEPQISFDLLIERLIHLRDANLIDMNFINFFKKLANDTSFAYIVSKELKELNINNLTI